MPSAFESCSNGASGWWTPPCSSPSLFDEQAKERLAAQDELLEMLLATLRVADDFESTRSDRTRKAQTRIVKVAEEYALAHAGERLYVTDFCRVAAVSERTLEYAFKEIAGLTPMNYLIRLRLHRVETGAAGRRRRNRRRCRSRRSTGASGTSASSRAHTRNASANCRRTRCDARADRRAAPQLCGIPIGSRLP